MLYKKTARVRSKIKGKPDLINKLDTVFSLYIRLKYAMPNGMCKCISCGTYKPWKEIQNGHYMSRRYMSTRFDEDNCRPQCVSCNIFNQGNIQMYRRGLIAEIGEKRVDLVEYRAKNTVQKYSDFELETLIKYYKSKIKEFER
jgi:hypothetical protein